LLVFSFFSLRLPHRHLHSFPTRRSSDLFAPDRTATVTLPPARAISLAISAPEFPTPTTSTRRPAYPSGRRYATLCAIRPAKRSRSEEHTSELQSRVDLVCRLLLEKKHTS